MSLGAVSDQPARRIYRYAPLIRQLEIRLLKVDQEPGSDQQQWRYTLMHTTIADAPPYETVSYVWGLDIRNRLLNLSDGTVLSINDNLEQSIGKLSQNCSTGYLWIDQLCINQAEITERNQQVKIMGHIYSAGLRVLVWLGPIDVPPCDALDWVVRAADEEEPEGLVIEHLKTLLLGDVYLKNGKIEMYRDDEQLALWQLYKTLCSPWFSRSWVYQEIVLSKQSRIIVGSSTVSLTGLRRLCMTLSDLEEREDLITIGLSDVILESQGIKIVPMMQQKWSDWHGLVVDHEGPDEPFEEFLSTIAPNKKASDPRDRLYAFLGLNRNRSMRIEPDYRFSELEAVVSVTRAIVEGTQRLDIFEFLSRDADNNNQPFVRRSPSWAPDFTSSKEGSRPFSRSNTSERLNMYLHTGLCNGHLLITRGRSLDRIQTRINPRLPPYTRGMTFDFQHYFMSAVHAWEASSRHISIPTKQTVFAALVAQGHCSPAPRNRLNALLEDMQLPELLCRVVRPYQESVGVKAGIDPGILTLSSSKQLEDAIDYVYGATYKRYLLVTENGGLALGASLEPGDEICILHGCASPVALRPANCGAFYVQETCFLEGWMSPWARGKVDWREDAAAEFRLV